MAVVGHRSVQEQNQQAQAQMRAVASQFKNDSRSFIWLIDILEANSESFQRGVLVSLKRTPDPSGNVCEGVWVSADRRFLEFSVSLPFDDGPPELEFWNDVTEDVIVSAHQPGTGKSFGFLALEILDETLKS